jgi:hypothetical protein
MGGGSWAWPDVDDLDSAQDAAHKAAYFAWTAAGFTLLFLVLFVNPLDAKMFAIIFITLVEAALYAVSGWQVYKFSRAWAVAGLVLYTLDLVAALIYFGPVLIGAMRIVFIIGFVNGVRGTFAYHRLRQEESSPSGVLQA